MSQFDDLVAEKGRGTPCDALTPISAAALERLRTQHPQAPAGYVDFLTHVGFGEIGAASFMLYDGLLKPDELFDDVPDSAQGVLFFGDDFAGTECGFDTTDGWAIVEVDSATGDKLEVGRDFAAFIRLRIAAAE